MCQLSRLKSKQAVLFKESLLAPDLPSRDNGPNRILHVTGWVYKEAASLKIGKGRTGAMPRIYSKNKFLTQIKAHNSVLICRNVPICNSKTVLLNTNYYIKFEENQ